MMDVRNFVGVFEQAAPLEYCAEIIKQFDVLNANGFTWGRGKETPSTQINDLATNYPSVKFSEKKDNAAIVSFSENIGIEFNKLFWGSIYPQYAEKYAALNDAAPHQIYVNKVQKITIGGGYHAWHFESSSRELSGRLLTYILYLNDVDEGGETEFLYYPMRVKPKTGTLILFPAGYTHTHRGNPPISNDKYILTGWVEF